MKKTINRMDELEIDEISSVDWPAQTPAEALIMKRRDDEEFAKRVRLVSVEQGHQHLIDLSGDHGSTSHDMADGAEFGHSHAWVRNDDGSITIGVADGHTHTVIEKRFTADGLAKELGIHNEPAGTGGGQTTENPMTKTDDKTAGADEAVEKRIQDAEARAEKAERLATLTDVQKAHYQSLDEAGQESFLGASPEDRQAQVEKAAGDDPVEYTTDAGLEIRKSAGALTIQLAKQADENARELAVEKAARQRDSFVKRAGEELGNLPGSVDSKVALLKAVESIPASEREGVQEILKAANDSVEKAFDTAGTIDGGGSAGDAEAKLEKMAQTHFEANGGTFEKSYRAVLSTPEGRRLYRETRA